MRGKSNLWANDWSDMTIEIWDAETDRMSVRYYDLMDDGVFEVAVDRK